MIENVRQLAEDCLAEEWTFGEVRGACFCVDNILTNLIYISKLLETRFNSFVLKMIIMLKHVWFFENLLPTFLHYSFKYSL